MTIRQIRLRYFIVRHYDICKYIYTNMIKSNEKMLSFLSNLEIHVIYFSFKTSVSLFIDIHVLRCGLKWNKANLRDFIAANGLVILFKLDSNGRFFARVTLRFDGLTPKTNKACLLYNIKLCVSFHIHQWIQTGVTVRKRQISQIRRVFFSCVTLQFDVWPWKTIGHLFYATSSLMHHFVAIGVLKLALESGNAQFGSNSTILWAVRPWNLTDDLEKNRASLQCYFKLCASFRSHWRIQTWVTVRKPPIWVKFDTF